MNRQSLSTLNPHTPCGDSHLMNFGGFATPERNLLFRVNDFDEAYPGPWEWDLKRLVASFLVAARDLRHGETVCRGSFAVAVSQALARGFDRDEFFFTPQFRSCL
jgi:uncharacterized protein (DUF2252 family)